MGKRRTGLKPDSAGQYFRQLGWKLNSSGKPIQPKFRLGRDRQRAALAYERLGALWDVIVAGHERRQRPPQGTFEPEGARHDEGPRWCDTTLQVAEAIRKGQHTIAVGPGENCGDDRAYVNWLAHLRHQYGHIIAIVPADLEAAERGRDHYEHVAEHRAIQSVAAARVAQVPVPAGAVSKGTLYEALDAYAEARLAERNSEHNRIEAAAARRLKDSIDDMSLSEFGQSAFERIARYWKGRPKAKLRGGRVSNRPISLDTVSRQLRVARTFVRWLDRSQAFDWEAPRYYEEAFKADLRRLRTADETAAMRHGVAVYTVAELATLYRHASAQDRLFLLLALNIAGTQAELCTLRRDEVDRAAGPPTIKRIRHKTGVYGEFALWPETLEAIDWHLAQPQHRQRPKDRPELLLTARGRPFTRQRIAGSWDDLLKRVQKEQPDFRRLPFKHLRKTAGQMVRRHSDGEIAGVFLCHGQPVKSDELSDVYTNRPFEKVAAALGKVREELGVVFGAT